MTFYSPSQVAETTGFTVDTLRYYERIGLLHEIARTAGGRRRFTETDVHWLRLLRCLRDTGMPIARMLDFMAMYRSAEDTVPQRLALLEEHDRRIGQQIARLRADQRQVRAKARVYRARLQGAGASDGSGDPA